MAPNATGRADRSVLRPGALIESSHANATPERGRVLRALLRRARRASPDSQTRPAASEECVAPVGRGPPPLLRGAPRATHRARSCLEGELETGARGAASVDQIAAVRVRVGARDREAEAAPGS